MPVCAGGTFTDVYTEVVADGERPDSVASLAATDALRAGKVSSRVMKLLSVNPGVYPDAPREAIRRTLEEVPLRSAWPDAALPLRSLDSFLCHQVTGIAHPIDKPVDTKRIEWIRMGTTVATNALLERKGERTALVTTKGFRDLLHIGNQSRPQVRDAAVRMLLLDAELMSGSGGPARL